MKTHIKKSLIHLVFIIGLVALAVPLTGCNTVKGFGEDLRSLGESIDDTAEETKRDLTD